MGHVRPAELNKPVLDVDALGREEHGHRLEDPGPVTARQGDDVPVGVVPRQRGRRRFVGAHHDGRFVRREVFPDSRANGVDRTRPFATVTFSGARAEILQGGVGSAEQLTNAASVFLAADAFGAACKLIELDVAYSQSREQFGQPIGQFQAIKHTIARIGTDLETTRGLWWYAAYALDHLPEEASHASSIAKAHIAERAMNAARESVELHGGYGFTWECEVQMWFKRIMFDRSYLGTPEQHRERCAELAGW